MRSIIEVVKRCKNLSQYFRVLEVSHQQIRWLEVAASSSSVERQPLNEQKFGPSNIFVTILVFLNIDLKTEFSKNAKLHFQAMTRETFGRIDVDAWSRGGVGCKKCPRWGIIYIGGLITFLADPFFPPHAEDKILFRPGDIKTVKVGRGFLFQLRVILEPTRTYVHN